MLPQSGSFRGEYLGQSIITAIYLTKGDCKAGCYDVHCCYALGCGSGRLRIPFNDRFGITRVDLYLVKANFCPDFQKLCTVQIATFDMLRSLKTSKTRTSGVMGYGPSRAVGLSGGVTRDEVMVHMRERESC